MRNTDINGDLPALSLWSIYWASLIYICDVKKRRIAPDIKVKVKHARRLQGIVQGYFSAKITFSNIGQTGMARFFQHRFNKCDPGAQNQS